MPNYTKTINLEKPLQTETYDVNKRNANWDKIDEAIKKDRDDANAHAVDSKAHENGIAGNAASANKLKTAVKINNTSFDGTRDVTTDKWGKARKISISDATKTNTGIAANVDGGSDLSLLLPAKIKVDIDGNATKLKNKVRVGIVGKVNAVPAWFDGSENINIKIDKVLESEKAINDEKGNKIDTTYLQLIGGTLTGELSNEAKYIKIAKSINATATGSGEDEESIVMARDKNGQDLGFINILRHKNNKNVQLRNRVVNKSWSDLRVIQDDDGNYWAEYAGSNSTNLLISQNDNSNKIPTTAWVSEATTAAAKKLDTAKAINVVGDFITGSEKTFDGTQNINIPLDLDKTIKNARIVASLLNPASGYIKWANGLIVQWGHGTIPSTVTSPDTPFEASYPIAFPNSCFILVGNDVGSAAYTLAFYPTSNTKFKIWRRHPDFGYAGETGFQYIAIGK